jgi:hypothetical protein
MLVQKDGVSDKTIEWQTCDIKVVKTECRRLKTRNSPAEIDG